LDWLAPATALLRAFHPWLCHFSLDFPLGFALAVLLPIRSSGSSGLDLILLPPLLELLLFLA
jgi:hypothetical protein